MKVQISDIGKIQTAELALDGITVIAGQNGSGKTSLAKAIYGILSPVYNFEDHIMEKRLTSILASVREWFRFSYAGKLSSQQNRSTILLMNRVMRWVKNYVKEKIDLGCEDLELTQAKLVEICLSADSDSFSPESFEENKRTRETIDRIGLYWEKADEEYASLIYFQQFRNLFENQIVSFDCKHPGEIKFDDGISVRLTNDRIDSLDYSATGKLGEVVFFSTDRDSLLGRNLYTDDSLAKQLRRKNLFADQDITLETYNENLEAVTKFHQLIDSVIHGKFVSQENGIDFNFVENEHSSEKLELCNMASGILPFAMIEQLIENGTLSRDSLLIIDEPEMNLHPEWQLSFAKLIIGLNHLLHVKALLISHSPYFIRAIEKVLSDTEYQGVSRAFYLMEKNSGNDQYHTKDVTNETELIYQQLYRPLEEL
ncbi:MAG: ATP-binding protein [Spirochaetia bacterium]|jgi:predicted ATPase|nr:ATP-binding protein [Spirochaetia bacterium]